MNLNSKLRELFPHLESCDYKSFHYDSAAAHFFNPMAVNNLEMLLKTMPNVRIVLSSYWREKKEVLQLKEIFKIHNFAQLIIGKTPDSTKNKAYFEAKGMTGRAIEIACWLEQHPEVKNFVILDDNDSGLSTSFARNFVLIDSSMLLTEENVKQAARILRS